MKIAQQMHGTSGQCSDQDNVPVACGRLGSWHVAISRRVRSPHELATRYDAMAGAWARTVRRFRIADAYRFALKQSGVPDTLAMCSQRGRVLDCGIGSGSLSLALDSLLSRSAAYHGIDISGAMLTTAGNAMRTAKLSPELHCADVLSIPYADETFDIVMAAHVLEHLPKPQRAMREMARVLKPDGQLFLCMTRPSLFGTFIQIRWRTWMVTDRQGVAWLRDCGLKEIGYQPISFGLRAGQASTAFWARKPN